MKWLFRITLVSILMFSVSAFAGQWCLWDGTKAGVCQSDSKGYIRVNGFPTKTPSIANNAGWYKLIITEPTFGTNQTKDQETWALINNEIHKSWTVRALTADELDTQIATPMPLGEYYLWKALITSGVITQQQAQNNLPQELIDAYQARNRLENP